MPMELEISFSLQIYAQASSDQLYYALSYPAPRGLMPFTFTRAHLARLLRSGAVPEEEQNQSEAYDSREREDHEVQHLDSLDQLHEFSSLQLR